MKACGPLFTDKELFPMTWKYYLNYDEKKKAFSCQPAETSFIQMSIAKWNLEIKE